MPTRKKKRTTTCVYWKVSKERRRRSPAARRATVRASQAISARGTVKLLGCVTSGARVRFVRVRRFMEKVPSRIHLACQRTMWMVTKTQQTRPRRRWNLTARSKGMP
jgi:hypothetical protein